MTTYFFNKYTDELNRIDNMLSQYPDVGSNPDPDKMDLGHIMLLDERKKLKEQVESEARVAGIKTPFAIDQAANNQPLRRPKPYDSLTKSVNDDLGDNDSDQADQVSPEERRRACEALKPNGCGPSSWKWKIISDNPQGFDFSQACRNHDLNYATLGFGFERANELFYREMLAVPPKRLSNGTVIKPDTLAHAYSYFVKGPIGLKYYKKAQRNAYICKYGKKP